MKKNLSKIGAFSLAFGCSIGWGAFIMPGTTFLPQSGVLGTILGILIGVGIMLVIAWNYSTMISRHPDAGGAFTYTSHYFGYDHGFLCAWFLCLTYIALIWANASAMALFARYTFGSVLQFGLHYQIAGYDVYLGECLLCILAMVIAAIACSFRKKLAYILEIVFAVTLIAGILISFSGTVVSGSISDMTPLFVPGESPFRQVMMVVAIIPWAFVGFESISHSAGEFSFPAKKSFRIMVFAIAASALAYILLLLCSVLAIPSGYGGWASYIADLGNLSGRAAVPTFSAIQNTFGQYGVVLLGCTMFSALFTSVIGNMVAASRMLFHLAEDEVLPKWFGKLSRNGAPSHSLLFILLVSLFIPFLGRTAIGWHVDVSNVGASVAYGYTSLSVLKSAGKSGSLKEKVFAVFGIVMSAMFLVLLLIPNQLSGNALEPESYLILAGWVVLGFILYRQIFKKDKLARFGKTTIVWIILLLLGLFTALSWQHQQSVNNTNTVLSEIEGEHDDVVLELMETGNGSDELLAHSLEYNSFLEETIQVLQNKNLFNSFLVLGIVLISVAILISNYRILARKNQEQEQTIGVVQKLANTDALTGVKNKSAYNDMELSINQKISDGTQGDFAVVVCDLNNLKLVNDTLGHKAGDAYIREGCHIICNIFQHSPVFRVGGDEFAAILENTDYQERETLMQTLSKQVHENLRNNGTVLASGMSVYDKETDRTVQDVFERADRIMYENKKVLKGA